MTRSGDSIRLTSIPSNAWSTIPPSDRRIEEDIGVLRQSETGRLKRVPCTDFQRCSAAQRMRISFRSKESPMQTVRSASKSKAHGFTIFPGIVQHFSRAQL